MKNEVKLNIHLFFPEQQNEEISDTRNDAFKALLELSEQNDENSIEKFISELENRFNSIKEILDDETSDFLGYNQEDIETIKNFFDGKYKKFGMDAVAVQKILRSIWLKTPCNDKRLNYDLYDFIDKKFYGIINERKKDIITNDIDKITPSSWVKYRNIYAKALEIDLEYLDTEAINGLEFPSASGLFANFSAEWYKSSLSRVEYLNYWMPHIITICNSTESTCPNHILDFDPFIYKYYQDYHDKAINGSMYEIYTAPEIIKYINIDIICNVACNENIPIPQDAWSSFYSKESEFYEKIKMSAIQPYDYYKEINRGKDVYHRNRSEFFKQNDYQLPKFINSCNEFFVDSNEIKYSKFLKFYQGEKFYFPPIESFISHINACDAVKQDMPDFNCKEDMQTLIYYYVNIWKQMNEFVCAPCHVQIKEPNKPFHDQFLKNKIKDLIPDNYPKNIFFYKGCEFVALLKKCVDYYVNDNKLSNLHKVKVLSKIKKYFKISVFLEKDFTTYIDKHIENLASQIGLPHDQITNDDLADEINYFYKLQEFVKLELELKETESKLEERNKNFKAINHDIKNMIRAVKDFVDKKDIEQADNGLTIITDIVDAVNISFKELPAEWKEDLAGGTNDKSLKNILNDAFLYCIPNMFCYGYERIYEKETLNYFEWPEDADNAKLEWSGLIDLKEKFEWITNNMFKLEWDDKADTENIKIGNRHKIATHFFILFNEIFLNAIKAISYVDDRKKRCMEIKLNRNNNLLTVIIRNSAQNDREKYKEGLGFGNHLIIDNYINLFQITDFLPMYDTDEHIYEIKFSIPVGK